MTDYMIEKGIKKATARAQWYYNTYKGCNNFDERCAKQWVSTVLRATPNRTSEQALTILKAMPVEFRQSKAATNALKGPFNGITNPGFIFKWLHGMEQKEAPAVEVEK